MPVPAIREHLKLVPFLHTTTPTAVEKRAIEKGRYSAGKTQIHTARDPYDSSRQRGALTAARRPNYSGHICGYKGRRHAVRWCARAETPNQ